MNEQKIEEMLRNFPRLNISDRLRANFAKAISSYKEVAEELCVVQTPEIDYSLTEKFKEKLAESSELENELKKTKALLTAGLISRFTAKLRRRSFTLPIFIFVPAFSAAVVLVAVFIFFSEQGHSEKRADIMLQPSLDEQVRVIAKNSAVKLIKRNEEIKTSIINYIEGSIATFQVERKLAGFLPLLKKRLDESIKSYKQTEETRLGYERVLLSTCKTLYLVVPSLYKDYIFDDASKFPATSKIKRILDVLISFEEPVVADMLYEFAAKHEDLLPIFAEYTSRMKFSNINRALWMGIQNKKTRLFYFHAAFKSHQNHLLNICREMHKNPFYSADMEPLLVKLGDEIFIEDILIQANGYMRKGKENRRKISLVYLAIIKSKEIKSKQLIDRIIILLNSPLFKVNARIALRQISGNDFKFDISKWRIFFSKEDI